MILVEICPSGYVLDYGLGGPRFETRPLRLFLLHLENCPKAVIKVRRVLIFLLSLIANNIYLFN